MLGAGMWGRSKTIYWKSKFKFETDSEAGQNLFKRKQDSGLGQAHVAGQKQFNWKQTFGLDRLIRQVKKSLNEASGLGQENEAGQNQA